MTLDEAINHCEEVAEEKEKEGSLDQESFMPLDDFMRYRVECLRGASEYRQIAEWLKELKGLREDENVKEVFKNCNTCKYESLPPDDFPCRRCCHRYINQYVYDDKRKVNADGRK